MTYHYIVPPGSPVRHCRRCHARIYAVRVGLLRKLKLNLDGREHRCQRERREGVGG